MTLKMPTDVLNKKQLLREVSGLELCCIDDSTRSLKYATLEGIQLQIEYAQFKPLVLYIEEGRELTPQYISKEMAEELHNERIAMLENLNIDTNNIAKYVFASLFVLAHVPHPTKEGTMKATMHQLRMIKER